MVCYPSKAAEGWVVFKSPCSASAAAQGHTSGQPKAPLGFEPKISCLQDRRFDQLSHGASLVWNVCMVCYPSKAAEGWMVFKSPCSASAAAQGHTSGQPKAPLGFEPRISCLLDRRFNQLSHGTNLQAQSPGGRLRGSKHPETRPTARHCTA